MKKVLLFFIGGMVCLAGIPAQAVTINKAAPVAAQETSTSSTATSLVPTVLNFIGNVQQLSAKQKELTAECIPSTQEINFVNNIVKEWAKTGAMSADKVKTVLGREPCELANGGYKAAVERWALTGMDEKICFDHFEGDGNADMVWRGFPKVGLATYCSDGTPASQCSSKNKVTVSDIYEIFNLVDFSEADYTTSELTMASKLLAKVEQCSNAKLSAKKRAMWGEFLMNTINTLGEPTNTSSILETVSGISNSGGLSSSIGSISSFATSLFGN